MNKELASLVQSLFEKYLASKEYLVYVYGNISTEFTAEGFLSKDNDSIIRKKRKFSKDGEGEYCRTFFQPLETKGGITKLRVIPYTGRLHQIRATLYSMGYPIVGDKLYGKDENRFLKLIEGIGFTELGIARQALHSETIVLPLREGVKYEFTSPEPSDMSGIFKLVGK